MPDLPHEVIHKILQLARLDIDTRLALRMTPARVQALMGIVESLGVIHSRQATFYRRAANMDKLSLLESIHASSTLHLGKTNPYAHVRMERKFEITNDLIMTIQHRRFKASHLHIQNACRASLLN
jgi:hypothetical protein